jgi:phenylacetic acid degradation operon negative regulatory protein
MAQERKTRAGATAVLLERPLAPRSLIASLLLGMRPPRMPAGRLVEWCGLFGVAEGTARVALSRMLDRGELTATGGVYELAGRLRSRQPTQEWSLAPRPKQWDGDWLLGIVDAGAGPRRNGRRCATGRQLRMVELRRVWCRPDNLPGRRATGAWDAPARSVRGGPAGPRPGNRRRDATVRGRGVGGGAGAARPPAGRRPRGARGADGETIADAFTLGAAATRCTWADPLLPAELCEDATGPAARGV